MDTAPCPCGKTTPRIMAITGRRDEMLKIKGTLIFPLQVEEAVLSVPGVEAHLIEVTEDERGQAQLVITAAFADETGNIEEQIRQAVKSETNITAKVKRDSREKIEEIWYCEKRVKPRKFWDRRG